LVRLEYRAELSAPATHGTPGTPCRPSWCSGPTVRKAPWRLMISVCGTPGTPGTPLWRVLPRRRQEQAGNAPIRAEPLPGRGCNLPAPRRQDTPAERKNQQQHKPLICLQKASLRPRREMPPVASVGRKDPRGFSPDRRRPQGHRERPRRRRAGGVAPGGPRRNRGVQISPFHSSHSQSVSQSAVAGARNARVWGTPGKDPLLGSFRNTLVLGAAASGTCLPGSGAL